MTQTKLFGIITFILFQAGIIGSMALMGTVVGSFTPSSSTACIQYNADGFCTKTENL